MASIAIIAATSDRNLALAQRFAEVLEAAGHGADVIELADMDLPIFTTSHSKEHGALTIWTRCGPVWKRPTAGWCALRSTTAQHRQPWSMPSPGSPPAGKISRPVQRAARGLGDLLRGGGEYIITAMRNQFLFLGCDVVGRSTIEKKGEDARQESLEDVARRLTNLC